MTASRSTGPPSSRFDRNSLLERTDLIALADELLGGHVGHGRSAKWPSPVPGHPQTGQSPPMSIFRTRAGDERWTCFSTGESGTAIDLVMVTRACDVRTAIEWLAARLGIEPVSELPNASASKAKTDATALTKSVSLPTGGTVAGEHERSPSSATARSADRAAVRVHPRVEAYVNTCERRLWLSEGAAALEWLTGERGFDEDVLHANRVGFDPGPDGFARPKGLPRLGPAVVLPALNDRGKAIFYQARYLDPSATGRKYDNPPTWLASNPKMTTIRPGTPSRFDQDRVVVTEGIPDALAAATAGFAAIAILGTANAGDDVARRLAAIDGTLVVAFDGDDAGRKGSVRLIESLAACGRTERVIDTRIPPKWNDLNEWMRAELTKASAALGRATPRNGPPSTPLPMSMI